MSICLRHTSCSATKHILIVLTRLCYCVRLSYFYASWLHLTCTCPKNGDTKLSVVTVNSYPFFKNSLTDSFSSKFAVEWLLKVPLHLIHLKSYCRPTNYELLRWLVETPSRDFEHYRMSGGRLTSKNVRWSSDMWYIFYVVFVYISSVMFLFFFTLIQFPKLIF